MKRSDVILADVLVPKNVGRYWFYSFHTLTLDVSGGIGATDLQGNGFTTLTQDLQVGTSGKASSTGNSNNNVGVGTSVPNLAL